ncbi:MAG TPA: hypothetical protein ENI87_10890 [bacterium]|nr:hypothetical protein [bacterium]
MFTVDNPPAGDSATWMFFSSTAVLPLGTGPFSLGAPPPVTVVPPGVLCFLSGQTWDMVVAAWGPALQYAGRTNVVRLTWQ